MEWYLKVLRQYADFSGRARRKEYWMFALFNFLIAYGGLIGLSLILGVIAVISNTFITSNTRGLPTIAVGIFWLYQLVILIPSLAVSVRRLHDTGKSGQWILIISLIPIAVAGAVAVIGAAVAGSGVRAVEVGDALISLSISISLISGIIGVIWLLVLMCTEGDAGDNRYGANPKLASHTSSPFAIAQHAQQYLERHVEVNPKPASHTSPPYFEKKTTILDRHRAGLSYLDGSGTFDEAGFREFNRIIGNRFSNAEIENQLMNAKQMMRGMEDLKQVLRSTTVEAIRTFEKLERNGIDLSKYDI